MPADFDKEFRKRQDRILNDLTSLDTSIKLLSSLRSACLDYQDELNVSPAFYSTVMDLLEKDIIVTTYRLFFETQPRTFTLNLYLEWVSQNLNLFSISARKIRMNLSNEHWVIQQSEDLTAIDMADYRKSLESTKKSISPVVRLRH